MLNQLGPPFYIVWREGCQLGVTLSVLNVIDSLPECSGGYISEIELYSAPFLLLIFLLAVTPFLLDG